MNIPIIKTTEAAVKFMNDKKHQKAVYDLLEQKAKEFIKLKYSTEQVLRELLKRGYLKTDVDQGLVGDILKKYKFKECGVIAPKPIMTAGAWKIIQDNKKHGTN